MSQRPSPFARLALILFATAWKATSASAGEPPKGATEVAAGLQAPGVSLSERPIDWSALPPWEQSSFFGVRSRGKLFVFVVDCSGSMGDQARLVRAKAELRRTIGAMRYPQRFLVIFYNDEPLPMPGHAPRSADGAALANFTSWLQHVQADGETDPRAAMSLGLNFRPDAVYLLTDGAFPDGVPEAITGMNRRKIPIHCIDMAGGEGSEGLRQIAAQAGGQYVLRP